METTDLINASDPARYPTLSDRVQSTFIDTIFIIILMFAFASLLDKYEDAPDWIRIALFFGLWTIYEPVCTTLGFTIGNLVKGIRVRRQGDPAKRINILQAFVRYVSKVCFGWLSFITIHSNPQRQALHDLAVGSILLNKNAADLKTNE